MLILMPHEDFDTCVRCLHERELRLLLNSIDDLLRVLDGERPGWDRHAFAEMWQGYEEALAVYGIYSFNELLARNHDARRPELKVLCPGDWVPEMPDWVGCSDIHVSHRSFLVAKDQSYYAEKFPNLEPSVRLAWPE